MVLDTVGGKLGRCTITSSKWGKVADHGVDLVHPPFWWYFWGVGLGAWGLALSTQTFIWVMVAVVAGYVLQRVIEGLFIKDFGMDIHVWQKFDSDFRSEEHTSELQSLMRTSYAVFCSQTNNIIITNYNITQLLLDYLTHHN